MASNRWALLESPVCVCVSCLSVPALLIGWHSAPAMPHHQAAWCSLVQVVTIMTTISLMIMRQDLWLSLTRWSLLIYFLFVYVSLCLILRTGYTLELRWEGRTGSERFRGGHRVNVPMVTPLVCAFCSLTNRCGLEGNLHRIVWYYVCVPLEVTSKDLHCPSLSFCECVFCVFFLKRSKA